jgi:hypothetical protein
MGSKILPATIKVLLAFVLMTVISCKQDRNPKQEEEVAIKDTTIQLPEITVFTKTTHQGISYSYVSPDDSKNAAPVVFFFDPDGNGRKCLEKYKALSKELGWVMVCSNYHSNVSDPSSALSGWVSIKRDVLATLPADSLRMIGAGFSGGARQAIGFLAAGEAYRGIIGNSAGFPLIPELLSKYFAFYGMYGNADMNLSEMENLGEALKSTRFLYHIHSFKGQHEWAPVDEMRKALVWMSGLQTMQINIGQEELIQVLGNDENKSSFEKVADQEYLMSRAKLAGSDCVACLEKINTIQQSERSKKENEERKKWRSFEERSLKEIRAYMGSIQMPEWKAKIESWAADTSGNEEKALANKRILAYLSLLCYTAGNQELAKESARAGYIAQVYTLCDPENAEAWIMLARYYERMAEKGLAVQAIEKAIAKGAAKERIMNYPELKTMD